MNNTNDVNLLKDYQKKTQLGQNLIEKIDKLKEFDGKLKLKRRIKKEIEFLNGVLAKNTLKREHLICTNLTYYEAFVDCLENVKGVKAVLHKVFLDHEKKISIDIIADDGLSWIKIIARNNKSINLQIQGDCEFGQRNILDHAKEFIQASQRNPHLFKIPNVIFNFTINLDPNLSKDLQQIGVHFSFQNYKYDIIPLSESTTPITNSIKKLNLDITCLIAYVSSLTNGNVNKYILNDPILKQQADWEREEPVKPYLDSLFKGKTLCACESAISDFKNIISLLAGPEELVRSKELLSQIHIVPDQLSTRVSNLKSGGKINSRSKIIFGTGDYNQWPTVTANKGFIRSANQKGVELCVLLHEARALTEKKQMPNF